MPNGKKRERKKHAKQKLKRKKKREMWLSEIGKI